MAVYFGFGDLDLAGSLGVWSFGGYTTYVRERLTMIENIKLKGDFGDIYLPYTCYSARDDLDYL